MASPQHPVQHIVVSFGAQSICSTCEVLTSARCAATGALSTNPATGPPAGPRIVDQQQTRMIENLKRENAALKKKLPGGGGGGGGGNIKPVQRVDGRIPHRNLERYHTTLRHSIYKYMLGVFAPQKLGKFSN